jgi:cholesterol transport system auxiliary component
MAKGQIVMLNRILLGTAALLALSGCISFAPEPPESLVTLTPTTSAPVGAMAAGNAETALTVAEPQTTARLAVNRIPVQVTASSVAYLKDAVWVERPTRLFRNLLVETLRARGGRLITAEGELGYGATSQLSGRLLEMGYDAASQSVIVRYDAVLQSPGGEVRSQRFEATVPGVVGEAEPVGTALNEAANRVATEVAAWVG